ncbi:MAG: hypothetical protein ACJ8R9_10575 [Steroidobacteraceae bacterium]
MNRLSRLVPISALSLLGLVNSAQPAQQSLPDALDCKDQGGYLCAEVFDSIGYKGGYTGHDEPSLLFYSNVPGSGNSGRYFLRLPKDPPTLPTQNGKGGTFNFQLHPAFWVSMALCDDQSAPNPGGSTVSRNIHCVPNSDKNIFDGVDPTRGDYIGRHPGTAFMEMQFYPPGWVNGCGDRIRWCSALNIDSLSENMNTGSFNNPACEAAVVGGDEPVNFAFITKSGKPVGPPSPILATGATFTPNGDTLFYNSGDLLEVILEDTAHGLRITIHDLTSGESGSMTASAKNGFAQVRFDPNGTECDAATHNIPADFHPIYLTSSEHTRVPWAAHSYNIAFSDEIGHFEFCNGVNVNGVCIDDGVHDRDNGLPTGAEDDQGCADANTAGALGLIAIGGCTATDFDFDGVSYLRVWPGTLHDTKLDSALHPQAVEFTSPVFRAPDGAISNYSRVAFETDLGRIESNTNPPCQRHLANPADPKPGQDCVNPPKGADFYPIYSTTFPREGLCVWQLGGALIPGTHDTFGGTSTAEYGPLLTLAYPAANAAPTLRLNDFRNVLTSNPCPARAAD